MSKIEGSIAAASSLQLTDAGAQYDKESKAILANKEFLAVILRLVVPEFREMTSKEVADCIDDGSISRTTEVSPGRTNKSPTTGMNTEFNVIGEVTSHFDVVFKVRHPRSKEESVLCYIFINIESQKNFRPGYPIEKRGIYYGSRLISSQFDVLTDKTDYSKLQKVYSIFICQDRIPQTMQNTVSLYEIANVWNSSEIPINKDDHDLMSVIIVRLGNPEDEGKEDIIKFLNALLYARDKRSYEIINEYVDFSATLKMEVEKLMGISELVMEYGEKRGIEKGMEKERAKNILAMYEEGLSIETIAKCLRITQEKVEETINEQKVLV